MASTYTGAGIELIGDGEQSGTWGSTTNANLQILDRLTSQAGFISLSGTTHTLTVADGTLSDGQYAVLVFGGSPSGTNTVTISPNDAKRVFLVKNASGQTVTLTQGSGGNVSVANGKTAIVYSDGAGAGAEVVDLTAALAVTALTLADLGVTASAAELNTLDGITATTAELNILDGVTATTAELNILDGVTATAAELNILDGVTATAAELNLLDGVTGTLVTEAGTQTLTNKTLTAPTINGVTITGEIAEETGTMPSGTTPAIDPANGTVQEWTLTGNSSPTDSLADGEFVELLIQDGTAYTITWPTITWLTDDGTAPTLKTSGVTPVLVQKVGSTLYGRRTGDGG